MSDMYAIKTSTLTAMGDAVRSYTGKYISVDESTEQPFFELEYDTRDYESDGLDYNSTGYLWRYHIDLKTILGDKYDLTKYCYVEWDYEVVGSKIGSGLMSSCGVYLTFNPELPWNQNVSVSSAYNLALITATTATTGNNTGYWYTNSTHYPYLSIKIGKVPYDAGDAYVKVKFKLWACDADKKFVELNRYTPLEMIDEINGLNTELGEKFKARIHAEKEYVITAEDLKGMNRIGVYAFHNSYITDLELPNTITTIKESACSYCIKLNTDLILPESVTTIGSQAFYACSKLKSVKIMNKNQVLSIIGNKGAEIYHPFGAGTYNIYVPSNLYNDYLGNSDWSAYAYDRIKPWGEYVFPITLNAYLTFNTTKSYSVELLEFETTPNVSVTVDNESVANVSNITINEDNTLLTFDVNTLNTEGSTTITVNIEGENTYTFNGTITIMETLPQSTYEVVAVEGITYGFTLNDAGYYESTNKGKSDSYAICQINISNLLGKKLYLDCINYAEKNYDYGLLGAVNQTLGKNTTDDAGVKHNFKGDSVATIQTVEYDDAIGDCFIQVKFKKDGSGDKNNDSIQFQVRFEE